MPSESQDYAGAGTPEDHAISHQKVGTDEIDLTGLVGKINLVDRGDPLPVDFTIYDLVPDATWQDLSLSSIVPAGALSVRLCVDLEDPDVSSWVAFRKKGNNNNVNISRLAIPVSDILFTRNVDVFCDTDIAIQYYATSSLWTTLSITVVGWWI